MLAVEALMKNRRFIAFIVMCVFANQQFLLVSQTRSKGISPRSSDQNGGYLDITASDSKARIFVDGQAKGIGRVSIKPEGNEITVRTEHPDYEDTVSLITRSVSLGVDEDPNSLRIGGFVLGVLGSLFGVGFFTIASVMPSSAYSPDNEFNDTMKSVGLIIGSVSIPLLMLSSIPKKTFPATYRIDMTKASLYDKAGYHKLTGFDRYGVNSAGKDTKGNSFNGKWAAGKKEGPGTLTSASGDMYTGTFVHDSLEGLARWRTADGVSFLGTWRNNAPDGTVIAFLPNGDREARYWQNGRQGTTRKITAGTISSRYDWVFLGFGSENGLAHGIGQAIDARSGAQVRNALFEAGRLIEGSLVTADGTTYIGSFMDDVLAKGIVLQRDGSRYEGELVGGLFNGQGKLRFANGESYEGEFRGGKPHGLGIFTLANGTPERCEFYEGKRIDQAYLLRQERLRITQQQAQEQARAEREAAEKARAEEKRKEEEERERRREEAEREPVRVTQNQWALDSLAAIRNTEESLEKSGYGRSSSSPRSAPRAETRAAQTPSAGTQHPSGSDRTAKTTQPERPPASTMPAAVPSHKETGVPPKAAYLFVWKTEKGKWLAEGPFLGKTAIPCDTREEAISLKLNSQTGSNRRVVKEIPYTWNGRYDGGTLLELSDPPLMDKETDIALKYGYTATR